jgi:hypothetical protein
MYIASEKKDVVWFDSTYENISLNTVRAIFSYTKWEDLEEWTENSSVTFYSDSDIDND